MLFLTNKMSAQPQQSIHNDKFAFLYISVPAKKMYLIISNHFSTKTSIANP
jgi:hypothetical protein